VTGLAARAARLPLRVRLVAGFSATMMLVLAAAGAFVYWRVSFALDRQVNEDLVALSARLTPLVDPSGRLVDGAPALASSEGYQVLDSAGRVLSFSLSLGPHPLLSPAVAALALRTPVRRDVGRLLPINDRPLRAYATALPQTPGRRAAVLVVAVRRDHRDEALRELLVQLAVAGFAALLLTAVVGYLLARLALRPVERYRAQSADIVAGAAGVRLDVPPDRDDEITRLGHTLNDMLDALESALDTERRFVNDASHELRTPLTLLNTRVQLALRRPRPVAEHVQILAEIQTDVVRLTQLAEQLLAVGAPGDNEPDGERADLAALAQHEVDRRRALTPDQQLEVQAAGPVQVALASTRVSQILSNLLDNATLHGRPPVTVSADTAAGASRLMVADRGDGMNPDMLATATHRFSRSPASRSRPGFGLGLSLVEGLVTGAGGELRLCYAGTHQRYGQNYPLACQHGDEMTVTVLLPAQPGPAARPAAA
jgi:two-component system, OmpR family, sensor kinase